MKVKTYTSDDHKLAVHLFESNNIVFTGRAISTATEDVFRKLKRDLKYRAIGLLTISVHLDYLNSGNSKQLLLFFKELAKLDTILYTKVQWFVDTDDDQMMELTEVFRSSINNSNFVFFVSTEPVNPIIDTL